VKFITTRLAATDEIDGLIVEGRMLDAWEAAQKTGRPFHEWPAGEERRPGVGAAFVAASGQRESHGRKVKQSRSFVRRAEGFFRGR
jgi:hypothetical protein